MKIPYTPFLLFAGMSLLAASCTTDDDAVDATVVKEWNIPLSTKNEVPAPASRTETGTAMLQLLSDNSLKYTISVNGLAASDALTAAHLHVGDVITSGGIVLGLNPVFSIGNGSGTIQNLRATLVDSLKNNANEIYINVHSTQVPAGLVRGQLNTNLELAADVALRGANEVPANNSSATGLSIIRLTSDKKLYVRTTVANLEAGDAWTAAHIHKAAAGVNGPILIGFYSNAAEFGTTKIITVDDATFASLKADPIYVNAHTVNKPAGLIRGQIR